MKNIAKKVLILVAHPDDEILGCGGTIAKYSKDDDIYVAILGEGMLSRHKMKRTNLTELKGQSRKANKILNTKDVLFFDLPDNQFDTVSFLEIVKKIENIIGEINPSIIYTHHPGDLNIDHRITFRAVLTATRPIGHIVKDIFSFEVLSSTEWSYQKMGSSFNPNYYEDISGFMEKKIDSMKAYVSEIKEFPHPRSSEGIRIMAQKRGMEVGIKYAEAFELIRHIQ